MNLFRLAKKGVGYIIPPKHSEVHHLPGLTAKRVINAVSKRLLKFDP